MIKGIVPEMPSNKKNKVKEKGGLKLLDAREKNCNSKYTKLYYSADYVCGMAKNLNSLRQNSKFCDVELSVEGLTIKAHRVVLSASSPYFQAMFSSGLVEEQQGTIELHDVSYHIMNILIDFLYTGEINIRQETVQELIVTADMLELKEVINACTEYMTQELHPSNALGIYRFATCHNCMELADVTLKYINKNFTLICREEEFFELPKEQLLMFLSSEHLNINSENEVFQAALRWLMYDARDRRRSVFDVLSCIRLPLLSLFVIEDAVAKCSDNSLKIALRSVKNDLDSKKGNLVPLIANPRLSAKKFIYVIGGSLRESASAWSRSECTYSSVERYDPFLQRWETVAPMSIGRILPGVSALNGKIYVVGGEQESQILANGECYDTCTNEWDNIASMIVPRCEFGMCSLYGNLYALGGWIGDDIGGSIEKYDPLQNVWSLSGLMPEPRFSMGVVTFEGLIYIVGGCTHSRRQMQDLISWNPLINEWTTLPSMPTDRSQMGVAVLDNHLYVVGGSNRRQQVLNSVERYSFLENKWSTVPPMKIGRASPAVAVIDGQLYVVGGDQTHEVNFYRAQITIATVECYDPTLNKWFDCPSLPESRSEAKAIAI